MQYKRLLAVLAVFAVVFAAVPTAVTAQQNGTQNATAEEDQNENATVENGSSTVATPGNIDTDTIQQTVSHVQIHNIEWSEDSVIIDLTPRSTDTIQITERYGDGQFTWNEYDVERGEPVRITYEFRERPDELAFAVVSSRTGVILKHPNASPIQFDRSSEWTDHYITGGTVALMVFLVVLYRYKRRDFFARTELRSMLSGKVYRSDDSQDSRRNTLIRWLYTPRYLFAGAIGVGLLEMATDILPDFGALQTEAQLGVIVAILGIPLYWFTAGKILELIPLPEQPKMLALDNRETGGVDLLTGARELFDSMTINGAQQLREKRVAGTANMRILLAHHYDTTSHSVTATYHKILDVVDVARNFTAAFVNHEMLNEDIEEAREIKSAQPALRQKYQREADKRASKQMDEIHFADGRSTNDLIADTLYSVDHDEEPSTVEDSGTFDLHKRDTDDNTGDSAGEEVDQ